MHERSVLDRALDAAKNNDVETFRSLKLELSGLSASDVCDEVDGASCVHIAARGGHVDFLQRLATVNNTLNTGPPRSKIGATPLHDAAATGAPKAYTRSRPRASCPGAVIYATTVVTCIRVTPVLQIFSFRTWVHNNAWVTDGSTVVRWCYHD